MEYLVESSNDTIAALATPPGSGALAIIRISGNKAETVLTTLFQPVNKKPLRARELQLGWIQINKQTIDQAMVVFMPGPNSYTSEDVVEFHLHGSQAIINTLLEAIIQQPGVRQAEPGEFTRRAFLHGKIDLVQAEAVGELISAKNKRAAKQASNLLHGKLSERIEELKGQIIALSAFYIANLDFSEEDIPAISPAKAKEIILSAEQSIETIITNAKHQNILRDGFSIGLVGLPNAGKSTLLNSLLGYDRALVTDIAGTTRDVLSESISINGIEFILTDTAGLHTSQDKVEQLGIEKTKQQIAQSDVVMLLIEPGKQSATLQYLEENNLIEDLLSTKVLVVFTKADIANQSANSFFNQFNTLSISSDDINLVKTVTESLGQLTKEVELDSITLLTNRQLNLFNTALKQLKNIKTQLNNQQSDDIVLVELQNLIETFNSLSGKHTSVEMINEVFANFCIGK